MTPNTVTYDSLIDGLSK